MTGVRVWLTTGLGLWRRVVRTRPAVALAIFAVTLVGAALVTSGARLLDQVSTDDLVTAVEAAEPRAGNIGYVTDGRYGVGSEAEPLSRIADQGREILDVELPTAVQDVIGDHQFVIESPPFRVSSYPDQDEGPFTRTLRFRFQSELDEHLTVVEGRPPAERRLRSVLLGDECPPDMSAVEEFLVAAEADPPDEPTDCRVVEVPVYEVAMTAQTATDLMVDVGDTVVLRPELTHLRWAFVRAEFLSRVVLVDVVGIIELTDPSDRYWFGDDALHRPRIVENPDFRLIFASAITPPVDYRPMVRDIQDVHFDYSWWYEVDPTRIDETEADDLAAEIDKLGSNEFQVVTRLPEIVNQHLVERILTVALMSTAFAGVLVVSAAAAFVLASLAADRQHQSMRLLLDRGVGRGGLRWTGLWHGMAVVVPAVVAAVIVADRLVDQGRWSRPVVAGGLVAAAVVGAVTVAVWLAVERAADGTVSGPRSVPRAGAIGDLTADGSQVAAARRLVRDTALVLAAVGAVVLVRRRAEFGLGVTTSEDGGSRAGGGSLAAVAGTGPHLDLLMAVAPPVIGLAAGVLTIRLMAPFFRLLGAAGRRLRGVVLFVGFRRVLVQGRAVRSAVVIVVLAVGMAGFATATRAAVAEAQELNGWQLVGADLALRGLTLDAPVPADAVEAADSVAAATVRGFQRPLTAVSVPADLPPAELLAVDADAYRSVLAGSPIDPSILDPIVDRPPSADGVIPGIVSRTWTPAQRPSPGDHLELLIGTTRVVVEVVGIVDSIPAAPVGQPTIVVDLEAVRAIGPPGFAPTTLLLVDLADSDTGGDTGAGSAAGVDLDLGPGVRISDRFQHGAELAADPFIRWVGIGLRLLTGFAVGLAVLAVISTLAISAPARKRDLGLLSTMGLGSRQAALVTAVEQMIPIAVAVVVGVGVAAGLLRLIVPALDLTAFAGGPLPVENQVAGSAAAVWALVGPAVVVLAGVAVAVLVSTWWMMGRSRGRFGDAANLMSLSMGEV